MMFMAYPEHPCSGRLKSIATMLGDFRGVKEQDSTKIPIENFREFAQNFS